MIAITIISTTIMTRICTIVRYTSITVIAIIISVMISTIENYFCYLYCCCCYNSVITITAIIAY